MKLRNALLNKVVVTTSGHIYERLGKELEMIGSILEFFHVEQGNSQLDILEREIVKCLLNRGLVTG